MIPYGKRLIELRGNKSQAEVAKGIGIATSTLGMYETQQRTPRDSSDMLPPLKSLILKWGLLAQWLY